LLGIASVLLYYITDRRAFPGDTAAQRHALLAKIAEAAKAGVDFIQLREKDLSGRALEELARAAVEAVRVQGAGRVGMRTKLLINSRSDVALAAGMDGVHLRDGDVAPENVRDLWVRAVGSEAEEPVVGVSCHTVEQVESAARAEGSFAVLAPVFEKKDAPGARAAGITVLGRACRAAMPVFALGGVTRENARACVDAGAAGIAGIRLFQENDVAALLRELRG
jgi:thiamine-phosphate pyrophosphorylase